MHKKENKNIKKQWKIVVNFTKIKKGGVEVDKVLKALEEME